MSKLIGEFDAGYDRVGIIEMDIAICNICKEMKKCLIIDNSSCEYESGRICKKCIEKAFYDRQI